MRWSSPLTTALKFKRQLLPVLGRRYPVQQFASSPRPRHVDDSKGQAGPPHDTSSIFNELFPAEDIVNEDAGAEQLVDASEPAKLTSEEFQAWLAQPEDNVPEGLDEEKSDGLTKVPIRTENWQLRRDDNEQKVVVLAGVSKSLLESDFYRIGPQGKHLDGWNGSIKKGTNTSNSISPNFRVEDTNIPATVVQARHPRTLEPQGVYYLLFDSKAAALVYIDEVRRLHRLIVQQSRVGRGVWGAVLPPVAAAALAASLGSSPADATARSTFTLAPPSQRLHGAMKIRDRNSTIARTLESKGSFHDILSQKGRSGHLLLLSLEGGKLSADALRAYIDEDGKERNLAWAVTSTMPWGPDLLQKVEAGERASGNVQSSTNMAQAMTTLDQYQNDVKEQKRTQNERAGRFILSFESGPEARRFLRNWHRRTLSGPGLERRTVNVSIFW
jgi:hypothetical protein